MTDEPPTQPFAIDRSTSFGDLDDQVVVVTGGNSGIGLGIARGVVAAGGRAFLLARGAQRLQAAVEELTELAGVPDRVAGQPCDVSGETAVIEAFAAARERFGRLDGLVCSHGAPGTGAPFIELCLEDWRHVLTVNLDGVMLCLREAARIMVADRTPGSMVVVSSLAAQLGQVRGQDYTASKGGVAALVRSCATELSRYGIRVNEIQPGTIVTPMAESYIANESIASLTRRRIPARRWGRPDELAGAAVYLLSQAARYHTGDTLVLDGGYVVY